MILTGGAVAASRESAVETAGIMPYHVHRRWLGSRVHHGVLFRGELLKRSNRHRVAMPQDSTQTDAYAADKRRRAYVPCVATLFTSDTHFGDHRVLNLYPRPFSSVAEMDEALVASWNAAVGPEDEVWHLGDFARTAKQAAQTMVRLNGRKHLVLGNNDPTAVVELAWASVGPYAEIEIDGLLLVLCHYPFRSWNGMHRGSVNLHGHSHGRLKPLPRQFDVGVDVRDYRPVHLEDLLPSQALRSKPP